MAGLLSPQEEREIRDAVRLVTDTFARTPILYHIGTDSLDRWQEDRADKLFYSIQIEALVENKAQTVQDSAGGYLDVQRVELTFNLEYLQEKGLIESDYKVRFNDTKDFFTLKGEIYQVKNVSYDGPLSAKDVLVIVQGEKMERTNMVKNTRLITNGNEMD